MQKTAVEALYEKRIAKVLEKKFKNSAAIRTFISRYGKLSTKSAYLTRIDGYVTWLQKEKEIITGPDQLIQDNLVCIYKSEPMDIKTKRKHTDLLNDFVNDYQVRKGLALNVRQSFAATIREFYQANDSAMFGDFRVSSDNVVEPPKPLFAEDIRQVLKNLSIQIRVPLLCAGRAARR